MHLWALFIQAVHASELVYYNYTLQCLLLVFFNSIHTKLLKRYG